MGPGAPFPPDVGENDIDQATLITKLQPLTAPTIGYSAGWETWSCAWSQDLGYFAWSCGHRVVKLIPWNRYKNTTLEENNLDDHGQPLPEKDVINIDCGGLVWSVAFGSSRAETRPHNVQHNHWYRYHVPHDLVLATGLDNGRIRVWDVYKACLMYELLDHVKLVRDLKFAPDGSMRLVSAARDGTLKLWDLLDDGNMFKTLTTNSKWLYSCAWSPDAKMLASAGDLKSVILWDMEEYTQIAKLQGHHHDVVSCDFSPDGALLVTASHDTRIIVWDPHRGEILKELRHMHPAPSPIFAGGANGASVRSVSFCQDGLHIASLCDDSYLRFWNVIEPHKPAEVAVIQHGLTCVFSPDGNSLAVGTRQGSVEIWKSPQSMNNLQHRCRMVFRRHCPSSVLKKLNLPVRIMDYLLYRM